MPHPISAAAGADGLILTRGSQIPYPIFGVGKGIDSAATGEDG